MSDGPLPQCASGAHATISAPRIAARWFVGSARCPIGGAFGFKGRRQRRRCLECMLSRTFSHDDPAAHAVGGRARLSSGDARLPGGPRPAGCAMRQPRAAPAGSPAFPVQGAADLRRRPSRPVPQRTWWVSRTTSWFPSISAPLRADRFPSSEYRLTTRHHGRRRSRQGVI